MAQSTRPDLGRSLDEIIADRPKSTKREGAGGPSRRSKRADDGSGKVVGRAPPRASAAGRSSGTRVFVGNLSWSSTNEGIMQHFSGVGRVVRVSIILDKTGRPSGGAIVEFKDEHAASRACVSLYDSELDGRKVFVREDREEAAPPPSHGGQSIISGGGHRAPEFARSGPYSGGGGGGNRVFVGNLAWTTTAAALGGHMAAAGSVLSAVILTEPASGRSKGAAIVEFSSPAGAARAIRELFDTELDGRKLIVREDREDAAPSGGAAHGGSGGGHRHRPAPESGRGSYFMHDVRGGDEDGGAGGRRPGDRSAAAAASSSHDDEFKVRVSGLPERFTWKDLKDTFAPAGKVLFSNVVSGGQGVVSFGTEAEAQAAVRTFDASLILGKTVHVSL